MSNHGKLVERLLQALSIKPRSISAICHDIGIDMRKAEELLLSLCAEGIVEYVRNPDRVYQIAQMDDLSFLS